MRLGHILGNIGEIEKLVCQLRCPDHVGLIHINVAGTGGQPELVLTKLVGGGRRHRHQRDMIAGCLFKHSKLLLQKFNVIAR